MENEHSTRLRLDADRALEMWSNLAARYANADIKSGQKAALTKAWHRYCRLAKLAGLDPAAYAKWKSEP